MTRPYLTTEQYNDFKNSLTIPQTTNKIAFTGHRPKYLASYDYKHPENIELLFKMRDVIEFHIQNGIREFISAFALGIDTWAVQLLLALKPKYPDIKIHAYLPCKNHYKKWKKESIDICLSLLTQVDTITYVTNGEYSYDCMTKCDHEMAHNADMIIAVSSNQAEHKKPLII